MQGLDKHPNVLMGSGEVPSTAFPVTRYDGCRNASSVEPR